MSGPVHLGKGPRPEPEPSGRFWSSRRVPAAIAALVLMAVSGLFLYDVAAVRAHHPAMHWRRRLAHELATRHLGNGWVIAGAVLAMLLGLWLIALAVTPGMRGVLPMRHELPEVRAGLDRRAAALVLRDRVLEIAGVRAVRVEVGRRVIRVRVQAHFRDLDEVRADVDAVLAEAVRELGLGRQPVLAVRVQRAVRR
ncbi:DUF6286 domain-containing protein [Streptomyces orinoci]|uniref:DUF6286 domain-containing protein n=1 Tax=Streptomyces orinoci TaxID=67339 RepID=A0ABV3JWU9_STRON|nr:DUF6286 domain-containing protein [Streptomyces orinoci]